MNSFAAIIVTMFLVIALSSHCDAKRGCNAFGHACFGGHGKRSEAPVGDGLSIETPYARLQQEANSIDGNNDRQYYNDAQNDDPEFRYTVLELLRNWMNENRRVRNNALNQQTRDAIEYASKAVESHNAV